MILVGFLIQSLLGIAQYGLHLPFSIGEGSISLEGVNLHKVGSVVIQRARGTLGQPNTYGLYIAGMTTFSSVILLSGTYKHKIFASICICCGLIALVITFSRGSWIACISATLCSIFVLKRMDLIKIRLLPFLGTISSVVLLLGIILAEPIYQRIFVNSAATNSVRIELMQVAIEMIKAHPLHGIGLNNFVAEMTKYDWTGISEYFPMPVHNYPLLLAAEIGIVGLCLFAGIVAVVTVCGLRVTGGSEKNISALSIGALGGLWTILVANMVDVQLTKYIGGLLFWVLLGVVGACVDHRKGAH